jgi:scyllo-inosose 3-dehydrogenase
VRGLVLDATWAPREGVGDGAGRLAEAASDAWRNPLLTLAQLPDPQPEPSQAVVEIGACGICGSDVHCVETDEQGYVRFSGPAQLPVVLGHEYAGRVVAVGDNVRGVELGDLVTGEGMLWCGTCEACRRGRTNQCCRLRMTGFSAPGAFAQYIAVEEKHLWRLDGLAEQTGDESTAMAWGALVEPMGCSYRGLFHEAGGFRPGAHVVVHGCGPIGLAAVLLCRLAGAATVSAIDTMPERVALATACGADAAWTVSDIGEDLVDAIFEHTGGWGADIQVEAAGDASNTMPAIERCFAPGGTMIYLGRTGGCAPVRLDVLVSSAARIVGSRGHTGGGVYGDLIRLMAHGVLDPSPMISATVGLAQAEAALERAASRRDGKILVLPRDR